MKKLLLILPILILTSCDSTSAVKINTKNIIENNKNSVVVEELFSSTTVRRKIYKIEDKDAVCYVVYNTEGWWIECNFK